MRMIKAVAVSQCCDFLVAFFDAVRVLGQNTMERYNDIIADAGERCGPEQPVSGEIFESYEFTSLLRDKTAARLLPGLSDEDLVILTCRCSKSNGIFSMHEKLAESMQALKDGSCNDEYSGDASEKTAKLLSCLGGLTDLQRYALCDMLRLMDANDGLTIDKLRARVWERVTLPLYSVVLNRSIMRPSSTVPRASYSRTASG